MSQRKSFGSKMLSVLLILIITLSLVAPNTVLAATMPGLKAAVTEENIMAILDKYDPDGAMYFRNTKSHNGSYLNWWSEEDRILDCMNNAVHEECHAYTTTRYQNVFDSATVRYHVSTNRDISVTYDSKKVYMTNELSEFIPDSMKYDRYDTYVGEGIESIVASSQYGVYGLLNEYNAYGWGFNNDLCMYHYVKDLKGKAYAKKWLKNNGSYQIGAYAEFKYWMYLYLLHAKEEYPDLYADIANNQTFIEAYQAIDGRYRASVKEYVKLTGSYGYDAKYYKKVIKELKKSKYDAVRAVLKGSGADTQVYRWTGDMEWTSIGHIIADVDGVTLTWKRTYDSDGYKFYRKVGKGDFVEIKDVTEQQSEAYLSRSYTDRTVKSGKVYSYYVVPYKNSGDSVVYGKPSITRTVETLESVKLTSAKYKNGVFQVKWTAPASFVGFEVAQVMETEPYTYTDGTTTVTESGSNKTSFFSHDKDCRSFTCKPVYGRGEYKIKVRGYVQRNGKPLYSNWSNEITVVVK